MKKTLLGVLAFVLVMATILTGTVFAADDTASDTLNVATVKMVDADHPIKVDGLMDEAYTTATPLLINFRGTAKTVEGLYTHGWARFVWSKAENALYCLVLMNDIEVNPRYDTLAYKSDSVEMFIDFTNTGTQNWGLPETQVSGNGAMQRGLQYRIDGFNGMPTCNLQEEVGLNGGKHTANGPGVPGNTYWLDEELGRMQNWGPNFLINENQNIFGWYYADNDPYKRGWGQSVTPCGYMVEFRIDASGCGEVLEDGKAVRFDFQVNDAYGTTGNSAQQLNVFYNSTYRVKTNDQKAGNTIQFYDTITLSEEVVANTYEAVAQAKLTEYGMADASEPLVMSTQATERTYTSKVTINREYTVREIDDVTTKATGGNSDPGNNGGNGNNGNNGGTGDNGGSTGEPSSSGCGGSIAIGTSVAMLALVGATGFFAFRKKDEE